jgi:iron complex outermembrane receptor protein
VPASLLTAYKLERRRFNIPAVLTGDIDKPSRRSPTPQRLRPVERDRNLAQRWSVNEKVYEGYGKLNFAADSFGGSWATGNVGVRWSTPKPAAKACSRTPASAFKAVTVDDDYTDVLPSANAKFDFGDGKVFRLGLAKVVARPPLDELRASRTLANWSPWTGSAGNPNLKPFEAVQFDASAEWYFRPEALVAASYYYKDVDSYIGWKQTPGHLRDVTYTVASPANGGSGYIQGLELTFQTPFFFLPGPLSKFGIYSNYAYVDSDLKEFSPANNPLDPDGPGQEHRHGRPVVRQRPDRSAPGLQVPQPDDRDLRLERLGPADPGEREDPRLQLVLHLQRPRHGPLPGQQPDQRGTADVPRQRSQPDRGATTSTAVASWST